MSIFAWIVLIAIVIFAVLVVIGLCCIAADEGDVYDEQECEGNAGHERDENSISRVGVGQVTHIARACVATSIVGGCGGVPKR